MNQTYRRANGQHLKEPQAPAPPDFFKAETLATFSHELGSPLAAITGYASTLLRVHLLAQAQERQAFLQAIQDAGDRMHIILDLVLKVSQMEAGIRTAQFAGVNLVSLVQEALAVAERNAKHRPPTQDTPPDRKSTRLNSSHVSISYA